MQPMAQPTAPRPRTPQQQQQQQPEHVTRATVEARRADTKKNDPAAQTDYAKWLLREAAALPDVAGVHERKHEMFDEALRIIRALADGEPPASRHGHPEAQWLMGEFLRKGAFGTTKNLDRAFAFYTKAAKQGHAAAAYQRGLAFELGHGTKVNETKAMAHFRTAATAGVTAAALKLGVVFQRGLLKQKPSEQNALLWLKRAAADVATAAQVVASADGEGAELAALASRNVYALHACYLLGVHYETREPSTAFQFYLDAAELGYGPALFKVALCLRDGNGTGRDDQEAKKWFAAAAHVGVTSLVQINNLPLPV